MTTGEFKCNIKLTICSILLLLTFFVVIGLSGNERVYNFSSSASVSCFSNFTILSIQWTSSSDLAFTTQMVGSQEMILRIVGISRAFHDETFTCEVRNQLSSGTITTSTTNFRIITEELSCKNHMY